MSISAILKQLPDSVRDLPAIQMLIEVIDSQTLIIRQLQEQIQKQSETIQKQAEQIQSQQKTIDELKDEISRLIDILPLLKGEDSWSSQTKFLIHSKLPLVAQVGLTFAPQA
jgi:hypothetical protein